MKGSHAIMVPNYLGEFMWREGCGTTASDAFNHIIEDIVALYPV